MREFVIGNSLAMIRKDNPNYSDEKMEIIEYGLTCLYIFVTKSIVIFTVAYFLGILKELIIFMLIYNALRYVSFGIHATSSLKCLISSASIFLLSTYICKISSIPLWFKLIFGLLGILYVLKHSPADTEKRPIVSPKRRMIYKTLSTIVAIIMVVSSLLLKDQFLSNSCIISLLIQCVMISPITYKLTNQKYDNYKDYKFE